MLGRNYFASALLLLASSAHGYLGGSPLSLPAQVLFKPQYGPKCSATIVAAGTLLLAGHCVRVAVNPGSQVHLTARGGITLVTEVVDVQIHPRLLNRSLKNVYPDAPDLALVRVKATPVQEMLPVCLRALVVGEPVIVGGYGEKGLPNLSESQKSQWTGTRKLIRDFKDTTFRVGFGDASGMNFSMGAYGDSGGGAIYEDGEHRLSVVGVNSSVSRTSEFFRVDPVTRKVTTQYVDATFNIVKLGSAANRDTYQVGAWLRRNLPASSFTQCR